jgi:drug/metabolite transporter (DMT)-like permease
MRTIAASRMLAAIGYLAVVVTALAFVLWYRAVARLGAGPAGLLTGVTPVAAATAGVLLGGPAPALGVWVGIAVVAVGLALGLTNPRPPSTDRSGHPWMELPDAIDRSPLLGGRPCKAS